MPAWKLCSFLDACVKAKSLLMPSSWWLLIRMPSDFVLTVQWTREGMVQAGIWGSSCQGFLSRMSS